MSADSDYEVLGLRPGASLEELKTAYRGLVKVWHPDRFVSNPRLQRKAQDKLKEINLAYERLQSRLTSSASANARGGRRTAERSDSPPSPPQPQTEPTTTRSPADDRPGIKASRPAWFVLAGVVAVILVFSLPAERPKPPESAGNRTTPRPQPQKSPEVRDLWEKAAPASRPSGSRETKPSSKSLMIGRPDCQPVRDPDGTVQVYRRVHPDGRVTYTNCPPRRGSEPSMTQQPDCPGPGVYRMVMEDGTVRFVGCPPKERAEGP